MITNNERFIASPTVLAKAVGREEGERKTDGKATPGECRLYSGPKGLNVSGEQ